MGWVLLALGVAFVLSVAVLFIAARSSYRRMRGRGSPAISTGRPDVEL